MAETGTFVEPKERIYFCKNARQQFIITPDRNKEKNAAGYAVTAHNHHIVTSDPVVQRVIENHRYFGIRFWREQAPVTTSDTAYAEGAQTTAVEKGLASDQTEVKSKGK